MSKISAKATVRKRSKRIQRKIDKRSGFLRHRGFRHHVFISKLSRHIGLMSPLIIEQNNHIVDIGREMIDIVKDATKMAQ